jgi:hypothetical protein
VKDNDEAKREEFDKLSSVLKGTTLKVYWYILRNPKQSSLREIQKGANLSSPSLATYHLDKLVELGLVEIDRHGLFHLKQTVKVGVLRLFVGSGVFLLPRFLFYAIFYSSVLPLFLFSVPFVFGPISLILILVLLFGAITNWIETAKAWRMEV